MPELNIACRGIVDVDTLVETGGFIKQSIIDRIRNSFWKQVMTAWNNFIVKHKFQDPPGDILYQPIWNNPEFKDKAYFIRQWFNAGIKYIRNIVHLNGKFKSFEELQREYGINDNFLQYSKLMAIIPTE